MTAPTRRAIHPTSGSSASGRAARGTRPALRTVAVLGVVAAGLIVLLRIGRGPLAAPPLGSWQAFTAWAEQRSTAHATAAVLRLVAVALGGYVVVVGLVDVVAQLLGWNGLRRVTSALLGPVGRAVVVRASLGLGAVAVGATAVAPVTAGPSPAVATPLTALDPAGTPPASDGLQTATLRSLDDAADATRSSDPPADQRAPIVHAPDPGGRADPGGHRASGPGEASPQAQATLRALPEPGLSIGPDPTGQAALGPRAAPGRDGPAPATASIPPSPSTSGSEPTSSTTIPPERPTTTSVPPSAPVPPPAPTAATTTTTSPATAPAQTGSAAGAGSITTGPADHGQATIRSLDASVSPSGSPTQPRAASTAAASDATPPQAAASPQVGEPLDEATWTVVEGESFWSIATEVTAEQLGRTPSEAEVSITWQALIEANRDRLVQPDNPDLLFPGQPLRLP